MRYSDGDIMIDTLTLATRLEKAGFSREQAAGQAAAMAEFLDQAAATRGDLELAKHEIKADIALVRSDLELGQAGFKADIERAKGETIRWVTSLVLGAGMAQAIVVAVLLK